MKVVNKIFPLLGTKRSSEGVQNPQLWITKLAYCVGKRSSSKALSDFKTELLYCLQRKLLLSSSYLNLSEAVNIVSQFLSKCQNYFYRGKIQRRPSSHLHESGEVLCFH